MNGQTVDGRPTPEAIAAITAAGGRIAQVYNVPIVRAELDLHRAASFVQLARAAAGAANSATTAENRRRAKYYRLTPSGRRQLEHQRERWQRTSFAVTSVLEGA